MKTLSKNWLTEHLIDFEYKQYVLLAYLNDVEQHFVARKLYPALSDLVEHYRNLKAYKNGAQGFLSNFKGLPVALDLENFQIEYEKAMDDDQIIQEIANIIDFSMPKFEAYLKKGKEIYEFIESKMRIEPVGLRPLYDEQGYMLLQINTPKETRVYNYQISIFQNSDEQYRGIHLNYFKSYSSSILNTPEAVKVALIKQNKDLPNPATFLVNSTINLPYSETYLPIAKRLLLKEICNR